MSGNSNPILKTMEVHLTDNEIKKFQKGKCPNCLSNHSIENWYCNHDIQLTDEGFKGYSNCIYCGQKYTEFFKATTITHFISFNEKGEKVYTCQEKTLRTANTKKIEPNSNNEEKNT